MSDDQRAAVQQVFDGAAETYDAVGVSMFQPIAEQLVADMGQEIAYIATARAFDAEMEDRIAKQTLKKMAQGCICPPHLPVCICHHKPEIRLLGKPLVAAPEELEMNSRSKSAKLRIAEKLAGGGDENAGQATGK